MARWEVELVAVGGALESSLFSARGAAHERRGVLLRLRHATGLVGVGEASPLPSYSRDTLEDCRTAFEQLDWEGLTEPSAPNPLEALEQCEALGALPAAARFAAETAWLDLAGQTHGRSLASLLGARPGAAVPVCALLTPDAAGAAANAAERAVSAGVGTVKLKLAANDFEAGVARIEAVRERCGPGVKLRLDANGSLSAATVAERLRTLARFSPEFIEEPVAVADLASIVSSPVPLALDESLQHPGMLTTLREWLPLGPCKTIVLKPAALGGLVRCVRLAREAALLGLTVTVSHLFDGPIALLAARQLALAVADSAVASGIAPHSGLEAFPSVPIAELYAHRPRVSLATAPPGLGLSGVRP